MHYKSRSKTLVAAAVALAIATTPLLGQEREGPAEREGEVKTEGQRPEDELRLAQNETKSSSTANVVTTTSGVTAFDLPSQDLATSLKAVATATNTNVLFDLKLVAGHKAPALKAQLTPDQAIARLIDGTQFTQEAVNEHTIVLTKPTAKTSSVASTTDGKLRLAQAEGSNSSQEPSVEGSPKESSESSKDRDSDSQDATLKELSTSKIPEILVRGSKVRNADIRRTRDDPQPYMTFDHEEIARSGAQNLEEFLLSRLPANAQQPGLGSPQGLDATISNINLRGLGSEQTLILVDGRRRPSISSVGNFNQATLKGIPFSSIERIEVLPSTASGIYGGSATGGVINIILKRQYNGLDASIEYGNTFRTDASTRRVELSGGFGLWDGQTQVSMSASWSESGSLHNSDRNFSDRAARLLLRTNPSTLFAGNSGSGGAVCSTSNLFFASACDGAPLVLDDGTPLNSVRTMVPSGYAGPLPTADGGVALVAGAGKVNFNYSPSLIWAQPKTKGLMIDVHQELSRGLSAYLSLSREETESENATAQSAAIVIPSASINNPFQQDIAVNIPLPDTRLTNRARSVITTGEAGAIIRLPHDWSASVAFEWSEAEANTISSTGFAFGITPDAQNLLEQAALRDTIDFPIPNPNELLNVSTFDQPSSVKLRATSARIGGAVFRLPGGDLTFAGLIERRSEKAESAVAEQIFITPSYIWTPPAESQVSSIYGELRAPIISRENSISFVDDLELMGAIRRDQYENRFVASIIPVPGKSGPFPDPPNSRQEFSSTDHTLGIRYSPVRDISVRVSHSTGFLPARLSLIQSNPARVTPAADLFFYRDPRRGSSPLTGNENGEILLTDGGNPSIEPELSTALSYGIILTPRFVDGLRISTDITDIRKSNEIAGLPLQTLIDYESDIPGNIVRGPRLPGDPSDWAGPIVEITAIPVNLFKSRIKALDVRVDYERELQGFGHWHLYALVTREELFRRQTLPSSLGENLIGLRDGPLEWRGNVGMDWQGRSWGGGWNAQYYSDYGVCLSSSSATQCAINSELQGGRRIPAQIYNDFYVDYRIARSPLTPLNNTKLSFGVQNAFDRKPPVDGPATWYSTYGEPRLRRFTLAIRKQF